MTPRRAPNRTEQLAAVLLLLRVGDEWLIPEPLRSTGSAEEIVATIEFDHYPVRRADGGTNKPQNLRPMSIAAHAEKTAEVDIPQIAKRKRLNETQREFCNRLLRKIGQGLDAEAARRKRGRPLPCGRASGWKKPLGKLNAVRRTK